MAATSLFFLPAAVVYLLKYSPRIVLPGTTTSLACLTIMQANALTALVILHQQT